MNLQKSLNIENSFIYKTETQPLVKQIKLTWEFWIDENREEYSNMQNSFKSIRGKGTIIKGNTTHCKSSC